MDILTRDDRLAVRALTEGDIPQMARWLSDPEVLRYYEGRDQPYDEGRVRQKFFSEERERIEQLFVLYDGVPLGYAQVYPLEADERASYGYTAAQPDGAVYGLDLFIGETMYWNRGIGTQLVMALTRYAVEAHDAFIVTLDPRVENARAVRCYEKAGYRIVKRLPSRELHEGAWHDCWLMEWRADGRPTPIMQDENKRDENTRG